MTETWQTCERRSSDLTRTKCFCFFFPFVASKGNAVWWKINPTLHPKRQNVVLNIQPELNQDRSDQSMFMCVRVTQQSTGPNPNENFREKAWKLTFTDVLHPIWLHMKIIRFVLVRKWFPLWFYCRCTCGAAGVAWLHRLFLRDGGGLLWSVYKGKNSSHMAMKFEGGRKDYGKSIQTFTHALRLDTHADSKHRDVQINTQTFRREGSTCGRRVTYSSLIISQRLKRLNSLEKQVFSRIHVKWICPLCFPWFELTFDAPNISPATAKSEPKDVMHQLT